MSLRRDIGCHASTTWANVIKKLKETNPEEVSLYIEEKEEEIYTLPGLYAYLDTIPASNHLKVILEHMVLIKNLHDLLNVGSHLPSREDRQRLYSAASLGQCEISPDYMKKVAESMQEVLMEEIAGIGDDTEIHRKIYNANTKALDNIVDVRSTMLAVKEDLKTFIALLRVDLLMNGGLEYVMDLIPKGELMGVVDAMDDYAQRVEQDERVPRLG